MSELPSHARWSVHREAGKTRHVSQRRRDVLMNGGHHHLGRLRAAARQAFPCARPRTVNATPASITTATIATKVLAVLEYPVDSLLITRPPHPNVFSGRRLYEPDWAAIIVRHVARSAHALGHHARIFFFVDIFACGDSLGFPILKPDKKGARRRDDLLARSHQIPAG